MDVIELDWNSKLHAKLRKAVAFLLEHDGWRGEYFRYSDLDDALNILCGYDESDDGMKKVDVQMIAEAFNLKGDCAGWDKLEFPNSQLTEKESGDDAPKRRRSRGRNTSRPNTPEGGEEYIFHFYRCFDNKSKKREYKLGCVKKGGGEPKDIESREGGWSPPHLTADTVFWDDMKAQLRKFLVERKTKAVRNKTLNTKRSLEKNKASRLSTPPEAATRQTSAATSTGYTPNAKKAKGNTTAISSNNMSSVTTEEEDETPVPLQPNQSEAADVDLQSSLYDEGGILRDDVAKSLLIDEEGNIKDDILKFLMDHLKGEKYDNRIALTRMENKLLGSLADCEIRAKAGWKDGDVKSVKATSFGRNQQMTLCRVPRQYATNGEKSRRTITRHNKLAQNWMSYIEVTGFRFGFVLDQIDKLTDVEKRKAAQVLVPTLSPEESAVLQSYCGMNNEQRRKLRRCLAYQTGIKVIAPDGQVRELKENHFEDNCRSAEMTTKELKRPVKKTKNGNNILSRKSLVLVFTVRPLEHVVCAIRALFQSGEFKIRLGGPCTVGEIFSGKVVVKISADAGGGSFKIIINLVNVKNPQGQEHVHLVGEFSGIKDTPENIRLAFFEEDSIIRSDIEAILNRQCVIVCLKMSDGQLQTIVVENDDADHDIMNPKPLPALTGVTEESVATDEANEMGIGRLKFAQVHELKVLKNDGCFCGISFFDSRGGCVATVMLREHLDGVDFNGLEMKQYMLISAHAADMEYMSGLIGHQGASAKNPCIYNRAKNVDVKDMWNLEVDFPSYEDRTNENIDEDFECFRREYENKLPRSSRTPALRKIVSQNMSHSIVDRKFYKFPMDVLNPGSMHVRTGNTRSLLDFVFHFYRQIADLVPGKHTKAAIFIEEEIRHQQIYLDYLDSQQKDVLMTLESKDKVLDDIVDTINRFRKVAFESPTLSQATRDEYARKLESLEQVYQSRTEGDDGDTEDEKKLKVQLLEQSCLVKNTIDHLQTLYKKHVCFSQRHIVDILKVYGVDLQVYFGGILIGPHCMNLAEHSEKILKAILNKMKEEVQDERLVKAMEKFTEKMVNIFAVWYELCMQMMSKKYQDDDAIAEWKRRVTTIKRLIVDLVETDPPLPGEENPLKLPTTLKWFSLLSSIMLKFLEVWRCFGDVDEQNIESNHPQRNAMAARHRGRRGPAKNLAIMKELEIERAPWMRDGIKEMLEATKAKRAPILRTRAIEELSEDADATLETENAVIENESVTLYDYELEMNDCDALRIPDDFDLPDVLPGVLPDNNNNQQVDADQEGLDPEYDVDLCLAVRRMDTTICACRECGERLIGENAMTIHMNEIHNHSILEENDAVDATVV